MRSLGFVFCLAAASALAPSNARAADPFTSNEWTPAAGRDSVAQNVIPRSVYIGALPAAAEDIKLLREDGSLVDSTVNLQPMAQKMMLCTMQPRSLLLPPGRYRVVTKAKPDGATEFTVTAGSDTIPPGAVGRVEAKGDWAAGAFQVTARFSPPTDDRTPSNVLAYNVYLARDPDDPDTNALPTMSASRAVAEADGRVAVTVANGGIDLAPRTVLARGTWKMRVRAVDEAGNFGPPSEAVSFTLPIEGSSSPDGGCACRSTATRAAGGSALGVLGVAAPVGLLALRRRRARRATK